MLWIPASAGMTDQRLLFFAAVFFALDFLAVVFFAVDLEAVLFLAADLRAVLLLAADLGAVLLLAVVFFAVVLRAVVFFAGAFFAVVLRAVVFLAAAFLAGAFLAVVLLAAVFLAAVFFAAVFFPAAFLAGGTLPPSLRASDRPIATACFGLVTLRPELLLSCPRLNSCIVSSTFSWDFLPYRAIACLLSCASFESEPDELRRNEGTRRLLA